MWESLPSLDHTGPLRSNSRGITFGGKCLYLLSYLFRPLMFLLAYIILHNNVIHIICLTYLPLLALSCRLPNDVVPLGHISFFKFCFVF